MLARGLKHIKVLKDLDILWSIGAIDIKVLKDLKSIPNGPREHPLADCYRHLGPRENARTPPIHASAISTRAHPNIPHLYRHPQKKEEGGQFKKLPTLKR